MCFRKPSALAQLCFVALRVMNAVKPDSKLVERVPPDKSWIGSQLRTLHHCHEHPRNGVHTFSLKILEDSTEGQIPPAKPEA
jgi:hypothetical protein